MTCSKGVPDDFYGKIRRRLYQRIGRELALAHRILDLGCGNCDLVRFLRKAYEQRVTGVDISNNRMPRQDDPSRSQSPMRCIQGNAGHLAFLKDGAVDAVITTWAVHEMEDAGAAVREAYRVLRPGGEMLIVDFPKGSLAQRLWNEAYLTDSEVSNLLESAGFVRVRVRKIFREQVIWAVGFRAPKQGAEV